MTNLLPLEAKLLAVWNDHPPCAPVLVVAVSGGADSVALLCAMHALRSHLPPCELQAAHVNHRLRGQESDDDQQFVSQLCAQLDVPLDCQEIDVAARAEEQGEGLEAAARRARYAFFEQLAQRNGPLMLLTAHTADDQAETILHRIVRGTGLAGLRGIPRQRVLIGESVIERPLLTIWRSELIDYLTQRNQTYRVDSSNLDQRHTRNRLRHELLVHLREHYNAQVDDALVRLGSLAGDVQEVVDRLVERLCQAAVRREGLATVVVREPLCDEPPYLVREVLIAAWRQRGWPLQPMGYAQWDLLARLLTADERDLTARQHVLPGHIVARRHGNQLRLSPGDSP